MCCALLETKHLTLTEPLSPPHPSHLQEHKQLLAYCKDNLANMLPQYPIVGGEVHEVLLGTSCCRKEKGLELCGSDQQCILYNCKSWNQLERVTMDRGRWRSLVDNLCYNGNSRVQVMNIQRHFRPRLKKFRKTANFVFLIVSPQGSKHGKYWQGQGMEHIVLFSYLHVHVAPELAPILLLRTSTCMSLL